MFWVISVYYSIRNTLPKSGTFLLGHPIYRAFIMYSRVTKINYRKPVGHVFTKPVQIEETTQKLFGIPRMHAALKLTGP